MGVSRVLDVTVEKILGFQESISERRADAVIHGVGVFFGLAAVVTLAILAADKMRLADTVSLGLYGFGLLAMLTCSAVYNAARNGRYADVLRRVDHAIIYLMIAGTYSPLTVMAITGTRGHMLFAFVWLVALTGAAVKILLPYRFERTALAAWLLLGWTALLLIEPLREAMPPSGLWLLGAGCALYSIGVIFHLWQRLPYHNAIWHGFVLAAAACHFVVVLDLTTTHLIT